MRKIINSTYITLDGAIEDPHLWPDLGDSAKAESFDIQMDLLNECDAVLMGRRTYESFATVWPTRSGELMADTMNAIQKLVVSTTLRKPIWNNTQVIDTDLVGRIRALKSQDGRNIVQYGLGQVSFALLEEGLVDEIRLWVHPVILGQAGSKTSQLFGCPSQRFDLLGSRALPNGIVVMNYQCRRRSQA